MLYFSRHRRLRALFIGSIVVIAFGIASWFAHTQRAAYQSREQSGNASPALVAEKGITPAANTIIVNSLSDAANAGDGLCTLREAIAAANNNTASGAAAGECAAGSNNNTDTINISVSGTIDLATALPNISDVIINGPGASSLTVRRSTAAGTPNFRIFTVSGAVNISGMTITNGRTADGVVPPGSFGSPGDHGGGIFNSGILTLTNMTITGNRTGNGSQPGSSSSGSSFGGPGGFGGGIYSTNNLYMSNVTVSNNTTGDGASSLSGGGGGRGGGVFISSGGLTMISCSVSGNATGLGAVSTNGGGGSTGGDGGGINIQVGSNIVIAFTSIVNNTTGSGQGMSSSISWGSGAGGGISIASGTGVDSGNIIITNCTISGNHTGDANGFSGQAGRGGGLTNASSNNLSIVNTTISGNQTGSGFNGAEAGIGAGMSNTATTKLINSTISGNIIGPTGSASGAGIWNAKNLFSDKLNRGPQYQRDFRRRGNSSIQQLKFDQYAQHDRRVEY
jgi:CSLREA domain-containing protein